MPGREEDEDEVSDVVVLETLRTIKKILPQTQDIIVNVALMGERLTTVKASVDKVYQLIFIGEEGGGRVSLSQQLAELRTGILSLNGDVVSLTSGLESLKKSIDGTKHDDLEMEKLRKSNRTAIIVALIAAFGSIVVALIGLGVIIHNGATKLG